MTSPVLDVQDLTVAYRRSDRSETVVVWNAHFSLERGSVLGLAGESGCGKSTMALAAIGYSPPGSRTLQGTSRLGGIDLLSLSTRELRKSWGLHIGYVAQNAGTSLNPAIPIGRQLAQPLAVHLGLRGETLRTRQLELLEDVRLPQPARALSRYPHEFSGGQQQRIAIAIALSCRPKVLILDEPTTGLDVTTQASVSALLHLLVAETGVATLYVSHDLALLSTVADRLAVMYAGEIVEQSSAQAVTRQPRHPYTRGLLAAVPSVHARRGVAGIPGRPPGSVVFDSCSFAPRCPHVIEACRHGHVPLRDVGGGHLARCIRAGELASRSAAVSASELPTSVPARSPLLNVINVRCEYVKALAPAVNGVSFAVGTGETLGIVGESGSGKSTLVRAIAGLHPPKAGAIRFGGVELAGRAVKRPQSTRGQIQIVFQNPDSSLNPRQTVAQILRRPIRLFRDDVPRSAEQTAVLNLLETVRLPSLVLQRYPAELSGGQRQRVALARAFAARPALVLCDEVTSSLDVSVQASIIELIAEIVADSGTAIIFVSHDLAVVRTIARRALVMRDGQVCEEGETERLFAAPQHPYTRELLGAIPELPAAAVVS